MSAPRFIVPLLLLPAFAGLAQLSPKQKAANLESFEIIWQTVRDRHPDPNLNGLHWAAIHDRTRPEIAAARTMNDVRRILRAMLAQLDSSHYAIIPGDAYSLGDTAGSTPDASPGFAASVVGGKAVVSSVEPGSSAARAGIKPGMVVADINGAKVDTMLHALEEAQAPEARAIASRTIERRLLGGARTSVAVDLLDANGQTKRVQLERAAPSGEMVAFANLPPMRVNFESRLLESVASPQREPQKLGYIRLNVFLDPARIMPEFEAALKEFDEAPGVLLDLRGNPGGIGIMAMGIAGFFIDQDGLKLGEMKMRDMDLRFAVYPRPHTYRGKLAVLVDETSASTSEILAQGLRDLGRARIFGERTAGAALPSDIIRLPNGDGFQYAQATYVSANGRVLEGNGVVPDVRVERSAEDLAAGRDPVIEAAVSWITSR